MKVTSAILASLCLSVSIGNAATLDRRVQINNRTSFDIVEFYASNTGSTSWEEDVLGRDILPSGNSVVINIDDGSGYCKYDFLAVFSDGDKVTSTNNNVCEISSFNFTE